MTLKILNFLLNFFTFFGSNQTSITSVRSKIRAYFNVQLITICAVVKWKCVV